MLFLVFSCYIPFTNTISTDRTYSTAGSNGVVLFLLKENTANMYVALCEFFGWLMLGEDAQLYLH